MGAIRKTHRAFRTIKWIGLSYVLSLVAGSLLHACINGKIKEADKPAMYVLVATVFAFVTILCTVGVYRWNRGLLSTFEKRFMVFSLMVYPAMFVIGWTQNIFH